jgi:urease subunit gamma/beta
MRLSPRDGDKLMLHQAGFLAQKRLWRGLALNYPEAVALIASQILEFIRDGDRDVPALMDLGKRILGRRDVMPGVPDMVDEVQVEGTFPDGTKLVTVHHPICAEQGDVALALYGTGLPVSQRKLPAAPSEAEEIPGSTWLRETPVRINPNRDTVEIEVVNMGDRPVQVGSHYPFFETNAALRFDRAKTAGFRLDIPSGKAMRFEPGEKKTARLVALAGERKVYGGNALIMGPLDERGIAKALERAVQGGYLGADS